MNVSFALGAALVAATLAVSPASASVSSSKGLVVTGSPSALIAKSDFVQGHEAVAGFRAHEAVARASESRQAAQRYFDFDVIVTLGALAMASGAFVAVGIAGSRRRSTGFSNSNEGWRDQVMQAMELDLARFTVSLKRAA
jgi:hypothetical protein